MASSNTGLFKVTMEQKKSELKSPGNSFLDFSKFNLINEKKNQGHCLLDTLEVSRLLQNTVNAEVEPISDSYSIPTEKKAYEGKGIEIEHEEDFNANDLFSLLVEAKPGTIINVATEDHDFNLFKSFNSNIFLIDSSTHIYKKIEGPNDFKVPAEEVITDSDILETLEDRNHFHYFNDNQESFTLYNMGLAHPSWNNHLKSDATRTPAILEDSPPKAPSAELDSDSEAGSDIQRGPPG